MRKIFINEVGRLRSGWRLLLFILAGIAAWFVIGAVLWVAYAVVSAVAPQLRPSFFAADAIFRLSMLASALGAGYLCARLLEGLPWRSLGLTLHVGWLRDLIIGSAVGFVSLAVAVGIATAGGGLLFSLNAAAVTSLLRSMIGSGALLVVAALAEEAMFRGYGLQTLARARLVWLGLLLTSVPFGLAHLDNPNVVPIVTFANTTIAGIWLGAAYLKTRSLWLPLGVHWAWNWALGWFFGLPISGINVVSNPLFKGTDIGPAWLTGGTYGIEGGIGCTVALILSTLFLWRTSWLSATPELAQLTSEENPATPEPVLTIRPVDDHA
jgi:membrane protease YdiL (CAAX protease family)